MLAFYKKRISLRLALNSAWDESHTYVARNMKAGEGYDHYLSESLIHNRKKSHLIIYSKVTLTGITGTSVYLIILITMFAKHKIFGTTLKWPCCLKLNQIRQ